MVIDGNLLIKERVVQIEKVVHSHEVDWENQTLLIQEAFKLNVFLIKYTKLILLCLVEVLFSIKEFVNIFFKSLELWMVMF